MTWASSLLRSWSKIRDILRITKKVILKKNLNIYSKNDFSRSEFQYVTISLECDTLIFKICVVSKVTTEKYIGSF